MDDQPFLKAQPPPPKQKSPSIFIFVSMVCVAIGFGLAKATDRSVPGTEAFRLGDTWTVGVLAFAINWLAAIPALIYETEHHYDLVGSITYLSTTIVSFVANKGWKSTRLIILNACVVWSPPSCLPSYAAFPAAACPTSPAACRCRPP